MASALELARKRAMQYRNLAEKRYQPWAATPYQLDQTQVLNALSGLNSDPTNLYQLMIGRSAGMPSRQALMRSRDSAIAREQLEQNQVQGAANYYNAFLNFNQEAGRQRQNLLGLFQQGQMYEAGINEERNAFGVQRYDDMANFQTNVEQRERDRPRWYEQVFGYLAGGAKEIGTYYATRGAAAR